MSIRKITENKYRVEIDLTIDGKRRRSSKTIETTLTGRQLEALRISVEEELERDLKLKLDTPERLLEMDLEELLYWYIERKPLEQHTIDYYNQYITSRPLAYFKNKKVFKIDYDAAEDFFDDLNRTISSKTKKPLSQKTKKHYLTALNALFKEYQKALKRRGVDHINPFEFVKVKVPRRSISNKFYSPKTIEAQIKILLDGDNTELTLMYLLTILGGLRPAELRGLKWGKIYWDSQRMLIDETLTKTKKGFIDKTTKNNHPRSIPLIPVAIQLLENHLHQEERKRQRYKIFKPSEKCFIFTNSKGGLLSEDHFRKIWKRFCQENGFEYKPPYDLRHSAATLLAYNKVPYPNIGKQLGHLDKQTTDIYIHAVDEVEDDIRSIMTKTLRAKNNIYKI